jgi:hypothetical protein
VVCSYAGSTYYKPSLQRTVPFATTMAPAAPHTPRRSGNPYGLDYVHTTNTIHKKSTLPTNIGTQPMMLSSKKHEEDLYNSKYKDMLHRNRDWADAAIMVQTKYWEERKGGEKEVKDHCNRNDIRPSYKIPTNSNGRGGSRQKLCPPRGVTLQPYQRQSLAASRCSNHIRQLLHQFTLSISRIAVNSTIGTQSASPKPAATSKSLSAAHETTIPQPFQSHHS